MHGAQRIGAGLLLCGVSFAISGLIQNRIDSSITLPTAPDGRTAVRVWLRD